MVLVRLAAFAVLATAISCSNKQPEDRAAAARPAETPRPETPRPAEPVKPAANTAPRSASADAPPDFPAECVAYAALIDKLRNCDKLGGMRDGLTQGYLELRASWPSVPTERRDSVAAQCKTQADSLRNAAAATCGW